MIIVCIFIIQYNPMKIIKRISALVQKLDLFSSSQFFRFQSDAQTKSLTGGIISIAVIVFLISTFYGKIIEALEKVQISSSMSTSLSVDPTPLEVNTFPGSPFMIAVQIWQFDLNHGPRMFDIYLKNKVFNYGIQNQTLTQIYPLQPCTKQHWRSNPQSVQRFDKINMSYWLCLPLNKTFTIQGKYSSQISRTLQFSVHRCTNSFDTSRPCATQADIDAFVQGQIYYTIYFINPLINAENNDFLKTYMQDKNYIIFDNLSGSQGIIYLQDFQIITDNSIWPFNQYTSKTGVIVNQIPLKNPYNIKPSVSQYCMFTFFRSGRSSSVSRQYLKIIDVISFIGGLFGSILTGFFLLHFYNQYLYQFLVGNSLFKHDNDQQYKYTSYNVFYFLIHLVSLPLKALKFKHIPQKIQFFQQSKRQIQKQIDICYVFRRIVFLEKCISVLLTQSQQKMIMLMQQPTLNDSKNYRKRFQLVKLMKQKLKQQKSASSGNEISHNSHESKIMQTSIEFKEQEEISSSDNQQTKGSQQQLMNFKQQLVKLQKKRNKINTKILKKIDVKIIQNSIKSTKNIISASIPLQKSPKDKQPQIIKVTNPNVTKQSLQHFEMRQNELQDPYEDFNFNIT